MIWRTRDLNRSDSGAVLVLALLFVLVVGLVGGALVGFADSSLAQTSNANTDRSASYAAESAIQVAIQQVRNLTTSSTAPGYSTGSGPVNTCPTTTVSIPEDGAAGSGTNESFDVMCAVGQAPAPFERTVVFVACPHGTPQASCLTGQSSFTPAIQSGAVVSASTTFDDLAQGCNIPSPASCFVPGFSVNVGDWDLAQSNN